MVTDTADPTWIWSDCAHCGAEFGQPNDPGRKRQFCSGRCRTAAYRARKRRQEQAEQQRQRRFYEQAREHARRQQQQDQQQRQRERARARASQPPPHAGTSQSGTWCGACGGMRGPHTHHHDDQAHARARRRYDGLKAKAASTSFPHEADACHAKADAMRDKYGL
jgi:hypothetical protein